MSMSYQPEPAPVTDLFGQPLANSRGELVPTNPNRRSTASPGNDITTEPASLTTQPSEPPATEPTTTQARTTDRARLLTLCHRLRSRHRCPGRCVLTGELRSGGLATFRDVAGGSP